MGIRIARIRLGGAGRLRPRRLGLLGLSASALVLTTPFGALAQKLPVTPSGVIQVPAFEMPSSGMMSREGNESRAEHVLVERAFPGGTIDQSNAASFGPRLEASKAIYPVVITKSSIAGVPVMIYEPRDGVSEAMRGRLLINVHGGGFMGCFLECGGLESVPLAALARVRVVSIDYREGPGAQFPQASEDVAAVYREILKTTDAKHIGLYGCSAGGTLTGQSLVWFQRNGLPTPAAAGIFCAGADDPSKRGDSQIIGAILGDGEMPAPRTAPVAAAAGAAPRGGYMRTASPTDPRAYPAVDKATLAKFPPTLVIAGARDFALSGAVNLHAKLIESGIDARLHVYEGGRHAFFYDARVPESRAAHKVMAEFFTNRIK